MRIHLKACGVAADPFLEDFLRTTVTFATWHQEERVSDVHARLDAVGDPGGTGNGAYVCCGLRAVMEDGEVLASGATGADASEAIRDAAELLELALHGPRGGAPALDSVRVAPRTAPLWRGAPSRPATPGRSHDMPFPPAGVASAG